MRWGGLHPNRHTAVPSTAPTGGFDDQVTGGFPEEWAQVDHGSALDADGGPNVEHIGPEQASSLSGASLAHGDIEGVFEWLAQPLAEHILQIFRDGHIAAAQVGRAEVALGAKAHAPGIDGRQRSVDRDLLGAIRVGQRKIALLSKNHAPALRARAPEP